MTQPRRFVPLFAASCVLSSIVAQGQWTALSPAVRPGARNSAVMAWDSARHVVVLHGGFLFPSPVYNDTWEWDGTAWTPAASGPTLNAHCMAYDSVRHVMVVFGGTVGVQGTGNTYEYDGAGWTLRASTGPSARANAQLCFDAQHGVSVLFGGHFTNLTNAAYGDTWEWNGTGWTQRTPATSPAPRVYHAMAYDSQRAVTVLFGGRDTNGGLLTDTWEWDGTTWTERFPAHAPSPRLDHEMAYDPARQRCVVHSGLQAAAPFTWEYDGTDWVAGGTMPGQTATRHAYGFSWDGNLGQVLLFGGYVGGQTDETWSYGIGGLASYTTAGVGCPGSNGTPAIAAAAGSLPRLGQMFQASLNNLGALTVGIAGISDTVHNGLPLPASLAAIGMPSCSLYVSLDVLVTLASVGGAATWNFAIPASPALTGFRFHQQGATLAPGVNAFGFVTSNYGTAVVGL